MKKAFIQLLLLLFPVMITAQESKTVYNFLRLPVSAHAAALGGANISIIEDDITLMFTNPALLTNVSDHTLALTYMNYMAGANNMTAMFNHSVMDKGQVAVSAQLMNYGNMKETDINGVEMGTFNAKDLNFAAYFSYLLTDDLSAGISAKFISSYIGGYNSLAMGVDLGLNYYNNKHEWSVSAVAHNLGGQLKAYEDDFEPMPIDVQLGVSKRLQHTPLRLNATMTDMTHWNYNVFQHLALGAEVIVTDNIWLGLGYNLRRNKEMGVGEAEEESSHWAGLSLGAGINLQRFKLNIAWGKYHVASSSLMANLAYTF